MILRVKSEKTWTPIALKKAFNLIQSSLCKIRQLYATSEWFMRTNQTMQESINFWKYIHNAKLNDCVTATRNSRSDSSHSSLGNEVMYACDVRKCLNNFCNTFMLFNYCMKYKSILNNFKKHIRQALLKPSTTVSPSTFSLLTRFLDTVCYFEWSLSKQ